MSKKMKRLQKEIDKAKEEIEGFKKMDPNDLRKIAMKEAIKGLKNKDEFIRMGAVKFFGNIGEYDKSEVLGAIKPLLLTLKDENREVRKLVIDALGKIGDPIAKAPLLQVFHNEKDSEVRYKAMEALVRIGDHGSLESLIYALNNNRREYDPVLIAKALGKSSDPMVIEPLIQALFNHKTNFVRASVAEALGNIEDPRVIESLIQALKGPLESSKVVAEVLGRKGDVRAIEPLLQRLYGVVNWYHDWRFNRPVGIWPSEVDTTLMELRELRKKIMEVLIKFGSSAVEYLIPALKNEETLVRSTAIEALGRIRDTRAVTPLIQALEDEDRDVRESAVEALGRIKDVKAVEPLIKALKDESSGVRWRTAEALGELKDVKAMEPLNRLLNDPNRLLNVPSSVVKDAIKKINSFDCNTKKDIKKYYF